MDDFSNNKKAPGDDRSGDIGSWAIIFIMMVVFWPVGLIMLLRKLNVFAKPSNRNSRQKGENKHNSKEDAGPQYSKAAQGPEYAARETAREAENVAREIAADIAQAARGVGSAARQAISEIQSDFTRGFSQTSASQTSASQPQSQQSQSAKPGTWKEATSQSQSWQTFGSKFGQSATSQFRPGRTAATQSQPGQYAAPYSRPASSAIPQPRVTQSAVSASTARQSREMKAGIKKERTALEKKSGKFVSVVLLLIAIVLFILGANTVFAAARDIWGNGIDRWPDFFLGVFYLIGGFISFFSRNISARRIARYKRYFLFVSGRGAVPISEIARTAGLPARVVKRDIQAMIYEGYLDRNAYIDKDLNCLILSADAAEEARRAAGAAAEESKPATTERPENRYMDIILELNEIKSNIADISISEKINRIEDLTGKIFRIVEENPEKLPQLRRFMNYYLPTTQKLLRSYATLEKQGIDGENITGTKESIGRVLDTLAAGFKQQLDQLFESDAIDIAADINVLENLMQMDGLTENKSELKTMEGV